MPVLTMSLTPSEVDALRADPTVAALVDASDWSGLVVFLNSAGGFRPRDVMTSAEFQLAAVPALIRLAGMADDVQRKWDRILSAIRSVGAIHVQDASVRALLSLAVADGLLTEPERDGVLYVPCAYGSSLIGRDVNFTRDDVVHFLGGTDVAPTP